MIDKWAKVKTVIDILVDEVLLHAITLLILVDALESESLTSTSFVGVSFMVDIPMRTGALLMYLAIASELTTLLALVE